MPTRLACQYQQYEWGKPHPHSKLSKLLPQCTLEKRILLDGEPLAELWMGTHQNGESLVYESGEGLAGYLLKNPHLLTTSSTTTTQTTTTPSNTSETTPTNSPTNTKPPPSTTHSDGLPFLFKILSVQKALSIQAHPNRTLAKQLHQSKPGVYKDPNHKPELCIALNEGFSGFCGFRSGEEVRGFISRYGVLGEVFGGGSGEGGSKAWFEYWMSLSSEQIQQYTDILKTQLLQSNSNTAYPKNTPEELFLRLTHQYPNDIGVFAPFLLNIIHLKPYESFYIGAGVIHAYLEGDCVECMSCSDNVVRVGLTSKVRDIETLVGMVDYGTTAGSGAAAGGKSSSTKGSGVGSSSTGSQSGRVNSGTRIKENIYLYKGDCEEFRVLRISGSADWRVSHAGILLCTAGVGSVNGLELREGVVYFISAGEMVSVVGAEGGSSNGGVGVGQGGVECFFAYSGELVD